MGGIDLATILKTTFEAGWNGEREAESRGDQIITAEQLKVVLGREDIDLSKQVVIATTFFKDPNIES